MVGGASLQEGGCQKDICLDGWAGPKRTKTHLIEQSCKCYEPPTFTGRRLNAASHSYSSPPKPQEVPPRPSPPPSSASSGDLKCIRIRASHRSGSAAHTLTLGAFRKLAVAGQQRGSTSISLRTSFNANRTLCVSTKPTGSSEPTRSNTRT